MAITGTALFTSGEVLTADAVNQYLMRGVKVFADATVRAAAYGGAGEPTLNEGETSYLLDTNALYTYDGAAWQNASAVSSVFARTGAVVATAGDYTGIASGSIEKVATVASASSIAITGPGTYLLTGTTTVATITGGTSGMVITLQASAQASGVPVVLTYGTGANAIKLSGGRSLGIYAQVPADTAAGAGESVTLRHDGTAWVEISRDLRKVLSYNFAEASAIISATTAASAQTMATASSVTFDGATPIVITMYMYQWSTGTTAGSAVFATLYDDATAKWRVAYLNNVGAAAQGATMFTQVRLTPTAAARAYGIRVWRATSNGEWNTTTNPSGTSDNGQGFIRIERDI